MKKVNREELLALAREINTVVDPKQHINVKANVKNEELEAEIKRVSAEFVLTDFVPDAPEDTHFSEVSIATLKAMGVAIPEPKEKKATPTSTAKKNRKTKKTTPKPDRFTRDKAVHEAIRKVCKKGGKGATLKQIMDETDRIYVIHGGKSYNNAMNVNNYTVTGLVAFGVLEKKEGKFFLTV